MLDEDKRTAEFIKPLFELRLMSLCGFMPNLVGCAECLAYESEEMFLDAERGEILCSSCEKACAVDADSACRNEAYRVFRLK